MSVIFSEIGEKINISFNNSNNILNEIDSVFKKIGVTKFDVQLLDINKLNLFEYTDRINSLLNNKNIIYVYSINERFEIFKQFFLNIYKEKSNNLISSSFMFEEEISEENNLFYRVDSSINYNLEMINNLINNNIFNISNSIKYLLNYLNNKIKETENIYNNFEIKFNFISSQIISLQSKYYCLNLFKLSLKTSEEKIIFDNLFNERKIKCLKEKIIKNFGSIKEKMFRIQHNYNEIKKIIEEKNLQNFEDIINNKNIEEMKKEYIELNNKNKEIKEKNNKLLEDEFSFISNQSKKLFKKIKEFIIQNITKEYFSYSSQIFSIINSLKRMDSKLLSYIDVLEKIDKNINILFLDIQEEDNYKIYFHEYKRRINFLQNLKFEIEKIKKEIKNENALRNKFIEELSFENKNNDYIHYNNDIKNFFEWPDIKINIDIFGDNYYQNISVKNHENDNLQTKLNERIFELNHINLNSQKEILKLKEELTLNKNNLLELKKDIIKINENFENIFKKNYPLNNSIKELFIINKTFFNYYNSILSIKNNEINNYFELYNKISLKNEDLLSYYNIINNNNIVNISKINKGNRIILFPKSGNYYGLILENNYSQSLCQYILNKESLDEKIKKIIEKKLFFIIGIVNDIKKEEDNKNLNQIMYKLSLSKIEHIFGTERINDSLILKNYI